MAGYSDQLKEILRQNGCRRERQGKGDHEIWYSPLSGKKFPIDSNIKSRHTANGILKQAGIKSVKIP
jgi:HicA toxin of bacterial toxin-antitoxin,